MRALTIALCLFATPALADVAGVASVIDGDTIEVRGQASASTGSTRRRVANSAAWTASRGRAGGMRRTS